MLNVLPVIATKSLQLPALTPRTCQHKPCVILRVNTG